MLLTPSNTGNVAAGVGVGIFAWGAFLKADKIPWIQKLLTTKRKDATLKWIDKNKGISLLGLETVNFSIHGVTEANSVFFALGNTLLNVLMLWIYLPFRQIKLSKTHSQNVLRGVVT
jgi:hypothetical protein